MKLRSSEDENTEIMTVKDNIYYYYNTVKYLYVKFRVALLGELWDECPGAHHCRKIDALKNKEVRIPLSFSICKEPCRNYIFLLRC
jgi:hypothetical protein